MSIKNLEKFVNEGKRVTFYLSTSPNFKSKYVCVIDDCKDEEHIVYADSVTELMYKLERKELN